MFGAEFGESTLFRRCVVFAFAGCLLGGIKWSGARENVVGKVGRVSQNDPGNTQMRPTNLSRFGRSGLKILSVTSGVQSRKFMLISLE